MEGGKGVGGVKGGGGRGEGVKEKENQEGEW